MSVECQVNVKSQSELDIGERETCLNLQLITSIVTKNYFKDLISRFI